MSEDKVESNGKEQVDSTEGKKKEGQKDQKQEDQKPIKPPLYKRPIPMIILSLIVIIGVVVGVVWYLNARQFEDTDDAFIDGNAVTISPNISATVLALHIDDNTHVKAGDLMIELDPRDFKVIVRQMSANLEGAKEKVKNSAAQVDVAKANATEAEAQIEVAQINADNAQRDYQRIAGLEERSRSQEQLDNAMAAAKSTAAQVVEAKAKLTAAQANIADAQSSLSTSDAAVKLAEADLNQAQINLDYCKIYAPSDGIVTRRSVQAGAYVEKAQPLFSLVPTKVWVTANYKETQLGRIRPGQDVAIEVDAFSDHEFHGKVDSIQNGTGSRFTLLPPENATGNYVKIVQRVPVKIVFNPGELDNANYPLALGMSVDPKIKVR